MSKVLLLGSTGLTGNAILTELVANPNVQSITTLSRSAPKIESPKIKAICLPLDQWFTEPNVTNFKNHDVAVSAFGTTRKAVGNDLKKWREVDYGTNFEFAKLANEAGIPKYILISSMGANHNSMFYYMKSKGELEEAIKNLGFKDCFILRPGALMGERTSTTYKGFGDGLMRQLGNIWPISKIIEATDVTLIGKFASGLIDKSGSKTYTANNIREAEF